MINQEIIDKALQELGVLDNGDSATTSDSNDMLDILNGMMLSWVVSDMDVGYAPQDTLSDTCPIPRWAEQAVISNLAVNAAPTFELSVTAELAVKASNGHNLVSRTVMNSTLQEANMSHLPQGYKRIWDIETG